MGYFPAMWTEGYIVPIHKNGNVNNVDNYRGITVLSILGKLFTRILNTRLTEWAETYYVYIVFIFLGQGWEQQTIFLYFTG